MKIHPESFVKGMFPFGESFLQLFQTVFSEFYVQSVETGEVVTLRLADLKNSFGSGIFHIAG